MGIISSLFPAKTAINSESIRDQIARTEGEIAALRENLATQSDGVALLSDAEHVKLDSDLAAIRRAITRLEARANHLVAELPAIVVAEESAAKTAADNTLRLRAEAVRRANTKEAAALLREYESHVAKLGDVFTRLNEISAETNIVNQALGLNPVAEHVLSYDDVHRRHPSQEATEIREVRPVWRYPSGTVTPAVEDGAGGYTRAEPLWIHREQRYEMPVLAREEVVASRSPFKPGHYELSLTGIVLPPGFAGGTAHWPRS